MKPRLTKKRLESLVSRKSVMGELLGNYAGAFSLGIVKYSDEKGGPALLLFVEEEKDRQFPRTIKRFGEEINIIVKTGFKSPQSLKEAKSKKPINLNKLVEDYYDTGLYLAVTPDHEKVVGTGKTIKEAGEEANAKGYNNPVILRAPSKAITKSHMHL